MTDKLLSALAPRVRTVAAAVCSIGNYEFCQWTHGGTEAEISAAAEQHAAENPGHRITCQVKQTRTWAILRTDHKPEGD